jgi:hypothetical protein
MIEGSFTYDRASTLADRAYAQNILKILSIATMPMYSWILKRTPLRKTATRAKMARSS